MLQRVRTRYAPSPTGYFHLGGARTALFNYLFAKKMAGDFILRIEDTDTVRNVAGGITSQYENLLWLNLVPDESIFKPNPIYGFYQQTQKLARYQELAWQLVNQQRAYHCFCSPTELEYERQKALVNHSTPKYSRKCSALSDAAVAAKKAAGLPFVLRLRMNDCLNFTWHDLIRGSISVPATSLTDYVIIKANGVPTYNFAVVVDDYDMAISHVLRGEEHIANTPYQIFTYQSLEFTMPEFGHLSIITNAAGKKLSKRDSTLQQFIEDYRRDGYLASALVNFLALLGWSHVANQEIFTLAELVQFFDLQRVNYAPAMFDPQKLHWISGQHFKNLNATEYLTFVKPFLHAEKKFTQLQINETCLLFQNQVTNAVELNQLVKSVLNSTYSIDKIMVEYHEFLRDSLPVISNFWFQLQKIGSVWSDSAIQRCFKLTQEVTSQKASRLYMPIRIAITGSKHGNELFRVIKILGYTVVTDRLKVMIARLSVKKEID